MYLTELESKIVVCTIDDSSILILHFSSLDHSVIILSPCDRHAVTDNYHAPRSGGPGGHEEEGDHEAVPVERWV